jgi:hypothetical protein
MIVHFPKLLRVIIGGLFVSVTMVGCGSQGMVVNTDKGINSQRVASGNSSICAEARKRIRIISHNANDGYATTKDTRDLVTAAVEIANIMAHAGDMINAMTSTPQKVLVTRMIQRGVSEFRSLSRELGKPNGPIGAAALADFLGLAVNPMSYC